MYNSGQSKGSPSQAVKLIWVFTSIHGRIGREVYWLAWLAVNCIAAFAFFSAVDIVVDPDTNLAVLEPQSSMTSIVLILTLPSQVVIAVKRLHDLNLSGLFALIMFLPLLNIFATVLLGIMPGSAGPNRFAEQADVLPIAAPPGP